MPLTSIRLLVLRVRVFVVLTEVTLLSLFPPPTTKYALKMLRRRHQLHPNSSSQEEVFLNHSSSNGSEIVHETDHETNSKLRHYLSLLAKHFLVFYFCFALTLFICLFLSKNTNDDRPRALPYSVWRTVPQIPKHPPRPLREGTAPKEKTIKWWPEEVQSGNYNLSTDWAGEGAVGTITF